jgi:predicted SprT family Zn-dependent metalloprotease
MRQNLNSYLPEAAIEYCFQLSNNYSYQLDFSFDRKTKFGHYKYLPQTKTHIISINKGLSKPLFLITFLHELAHLDVMLRYGKSAKPHGKEWKLTFSQFLVPVLNELNFEPQLLFALRKHIAKPKASLAADPSLWKALFETNPSELTLDEIADGELFIYKNRSFKKLKTRRTRALCYESKTGHNYLIPRLAKISRIN